LAAARVYDALDFLVPIFVGADPLGENARKASRP
jgi:hypothetical protein